MIQNDLKRAKKVEELLGLYRNKHYTPIYYDGTQEKINKLEKELKEMKLKTCKDVIPREVTKVYDFLLKHTPVSSTWIITSGGWRVATFYIDDEDLWVSWYPKQHDNAYVKHYSYDETTKKGYIEYINGKINENYNLV